MSQSSQNHRQLIAEAHALQPVVMIGQKGLTEAVITEIDRALFDHELIKIKIDADSKEGRLQITKAIESRLQATCLRVIGHIAIFYRPVPV